jgi:hypothetical protein
MTKNRGVASCHAYSKSGHMRLVQSASRQSRMIPYGPGLISTPQCPNVVWCDLDDVLGLYRIAVEAV